MPSVTVNAACPECEADVDLDFAVYFGHKARPDWGYSDDPPEVNLVSDAHCRSCGHKLEGRDLVDPEGRALETAGGDA